HIAMGDTLYQMGELLLAKEHLEKAILLYDRDHHRPLAIRFIGLDSEVQCLSYLAYTLWALGYPDEALQRAHEAVALAQEMSHPYSLVFARTFKGYLHRFRREGSLAQEYSESVRTLVVEHGFTWLPEATIL